MAIRSLVTVVRLQEQGSNGYSQSKSSSSNENQNLSIPQRTPQNPAMPFLSIAKPSWPVTTESNVRKKRRKKPDPHCVICLGSGRVDCHKCRGKGRTNHVESEMLPRGEWPKWCRKCGGSGLGYCDRCLGTGEYRNIMGFHFMDIPQDP